MKAGRRAAGRAAAGAWWRGSLSNSRRAITTHHPRSTRACRKPLRRRSWFGAQQHTRNDRARQVSQGRCERLAASWNAYEHSRASVPRGEPSKNALVGLLTSELGKVGLLVAHGAAHGRPRRQWLESASLVALGYSGGAVPESHRSSLFVGHFSRNARPPTQLGVNVAIAGGDVKQARPKSSCLANARMTSARSKSPQETPSQILAPAASCSP